MVLMNIVPVNVPALLCLDVLDAEGLYAVNFINRLVHRKINSRSRELLVYADTSHVPIVRLDAHLYSRMSFRNTTFYTQQLQNLNRQFAHHSAKSLNNLLRRVRLEAVNSEALERLNEIVSRCEPCQ